MPPKDSFMDSVPEPQQIDEDSIGPLHNYQVTYENPNDNNDMTVILVAATNVYTEGDQYEFWYGNVLALAVAEEIVLEVRNVSLLDMQL